MEKYVFVILMVQNFKMVCWILENRILVNRKWKLENNHQIKAWMMPRKKFANSFLIFWVFLVENWVSMFSKRYYSKKFSKNENFEVFLRAMTCYFHTPKYPKKSTMKIDFLGKHVMIHVYCEGLLRLSSPLYILRLW
jgi:hypothetical protein